MYITQSLQNLHDDHMDPDLLQETKYDRFLSFKVYSYDTCLNDLLSKRNVISLIVTANNSQDPQFLLCKRLHKSKMCELISVTFKDNEGFNKCGIWYAPSSFNDSPNVTNISRGEVDNMATDYAVLCPCISHVDELNICYTILTRNWKYRIAPNCLSYPILSFSFIEGIIKDNEKRQARQARQDAANNMI